MKKILFICFLMFIVSTLSFSVLSADPVLIDNGHCGGSDDVFWSFYDDGSLVIEGSGKIESFNGYNDLPYIEFFEANAVKSVIIKDGITEIGDYAFYECCAETIELAATVKKIGNYAFFGMNNAENIFLSKKVSSLGENAFSCSEKLKISVDGNSNYFAADEYGIIYNYDKTDVIFCPVDSDLSNYVFPSSVTYIGKNAFNGVKNLSKVLLPKALKIIDEGAFKNCRNLEAVIINYGITGIESGAFENCTNLNEIYYYSTEELLAEVSMDNCGIDKSGVVCGYCKHINTSSFDSSPAVCNNPGYSESVFCNDCGIFTVAKNVVIKNHADSDKNNTCDNCGGEYCRVADAGFCFKNDSNSDIIWVLYDNGNLVIYGSGGMKNYSRHEAPYYVHRDEITKVTIGNGIEHIGANAFYDMHGIETVSGGENVTTVGEGAFENARLLSSVDGLRNLEEVQDRAFRNCSLTDWNFGSKIKNIGFESFCGCKFKSIKLSDSVEMLGDKAFYSCLLLEKIFIGEKVHFIGEDTFGNCPSLSEIDTDGFNINYYVQGNVLFSKKSKELVKYPQALTDKSYRIPDGTEGISYGAFSGCENIEIIGINDELQTIGDYAFSFCSSISAMEIPYGVEKIGEGAFSYCENLTGVTVPESVNLIDKYAFAYCKNLKKIILPYKITKISEGTFYSCEKLETITIGASLKLIEKSAFGLCKGIKIVLCSGYEESFKELISEKTDNMYFASALKHFSDHNVTASAEVLPVCVNGGYTAGTYCEQCKYYLTGHERIEPEYKEHTVGDFVVVKKSTCTKKGESRAYCIRECGYYVKKTIGLSKHKYATSVTVPTCTYYGYTTYTCSCGDSYIDGFKDKAKHKLSEYYVVTSPKCTQKGKERANCTECTYYTERSIPAKGHSYKLSSVKKPTCSAEGYSIYKCSCGASRNDDITKKTSHNLSKYYVATAPECTKKGKERADCTKCTYYTERSIPAKGHSYKLSSVKKPTCTKDGYSVYKCPCGESKKTDVTARLGHSYQSSFTVDKKATCNSTGTKSRHCKRCKAKTDEKTIKRISHKYSYVITGATLKKNGSKKKTCSMCGKVSSTETIYKIESVKLSDTTYIYDKKTKKPAVTVKNSKGKTLKEGTDYTVKYQSGRKKTGKYTVKVSFKGKYSGSKTLSFKILPQNVKKVTSTPSLNSIRLSWNEVRGATGYRIYYYNSKTKKYVALKDTKNLSYTVKTIGGEKLNSGADYKFAVKAYSDNSGEKVFSSKSKKHTAATKPAKAKLKTPSASTGKITVKWKKMNCDGYELIYATNKSFSSPKKVVIKKASVTGNVIKGTVKGKTYFVKIRCYKVIGGEKVYGYYSDVKKIKAK